MYKKHRELESDGEDYRGLPYYSSGLPFPGDTGYRAGNRSQTDTTPLHNPCSIDRQLSAYYRGTKGR